jgi:DNA-binding transcriptional LysR family regulator
VPLSVIWCLHAARRRLAPAADAASLTPCPEQKKGQLANALFGQAEQSCSQAHFIRPAASLPGYRQDVELRQLEAFVAVATELHFGRAAERLHIAAPTLSELIRRLERELGTPLFTRTTRQVALTSAGAELLTRAKVILDEAAAAQAAVRRVADGEEGAVRLGITPPAAPVLAPHLINLFTAEAPQVTVDLQRMWLPDLLGAVAAGDIDVALTCGPVSEPAGIATEVFCAEPLVVGLRPSHRLASRDTIALSDLAHEVLGTAPEALFPAWALAERQALDTAGIAPPAIELADTDLAAIRWASQPDIDWILLIPSLAAAHTQTVIRPVTPRQLVPFTLQWNPSRVHTMAVARFVHCALAADLPPGWYTQPDHLHHTEPAENPADPQLSPQRH